MIKITTINGTPAWVTLANVDAVIQRDSEPDRYTIILNSGNMIDIAKSEAERLTTT
jgi:uncharacterized protein YlzI (FlbEa/FlbD family)